MNISQLFIKRWIVLQTLPQLVCARCSYKPGGVGKLVARVRQTQFTLDNLRKQGDVGATDERKRSDLGRV